MNTTRKSTSSSTRALMPHKKNNEKNSPEQKIARSSLFKRTTNVSRYNGTCGASEFKIKRHRKELASNIIKNGMAEQ
jgi:hypothetical protein